MRSCESRSMESRATSVPALRGAAFRITRSHFRGDDECSADENQEKRKELTSGKSANQGRVRFAEIFNDDPEDGVADEEQPGQNTVRLARPGPDKPKNS